MDKKSVCFIVNPISGTGRKNDFEALIRKHLDTSKFDYVYHETQRAGEAVEIARGAVERKTSVIVAVGGDGTINEIVRAMQGSESMLAIVPQGSGNGLARHLGIPLKAEKALQLINEEHCIPIDVASVNGHPFVSIAGVGFDARVAHHYQKFGKRGLAGYFRVVLTQFFNYKSREFDLQIGDETIRRKAMLVSLANSNQFGYGTIIAPDASLTDGKLDVVVVRKFPAWEVPLIMHLTYNKKINKSRYVETFTASHLTIYRGKGKRVNIDGEPVRMGRKLDVQVNPGALKIIIPKE
jgi:diacylglycerol kinase (ATP)